MRVLSVRQPWASLIASGRKSLELRSWATTYRGSVLIVSGSKPWAGDHGFELGPLGVTICVVELVDCRSATPNDKHAACVAPPDDWFAWVLSSPKQVGHVHIKGRLGLYHPDARLSLVAAA